MPKKRHSAEQIIHKLREAEVALSQGQIVGAVCKQIGVTQQTYYRWRKEYGGLLEWNGWPCSKRERGVHEEPGTGPAGGPRSPVGVLNSP